jgi:hypothetical protein
MNCQIIHPAQQRTDSPKKDLPQTSLASAPQPMDIESTVAVDASPVKASTATPPVLKKKKKTSYKDMMASMTTSDAPRDIEKEKDSIRKATGGGAFAKVDKI